jgi:hypothetical protein
LSDTFISHTPTLILGKPIPEVLEKAQEIQGDFEQPGLANYRPDIADPSTKMRRIERQVEPEPKRAQAFKMRIAHILKA